MIDAVSGAHLQVYMQLMNGAPFPHLDHLVQFLSSCSEDPSLGYHIFMLLQHVLQHRENKVVVGVCALCSPQTSSPSEPSFSLSPWLVRALQVDATKIVPTMIHFVKKALPFAMSSGGESDIESDSPVMLCQLCLTLLSRLLLYDGDQKRQVFFPLFLVLILSGVCVRARACMFLSVWLDLFSPLLLPH